MFATSYCLIFNFYPKLEMTPVTCLRSFGQNEMTLNMSLSRKNFFPILIATTIGVLLTSVTRY